MYFKAFLLNISVLVLFVSTPVIANNFTLSGVFDGNEPTMAADPSSCDGVAKRYRVAGTVTVSASGSYTFVDAGNWFPFGLPQSSIADAVIMIYAGSFNPASPAANRVASVDEYDTVQLNTGTSYVLVVQHWCDENNGAFAMLIEGGQATVSGDGFTSLPQTIGSLDALSPSAYFSYLGGVRRYRADPITVSVSGTYYFVDVGQEFGGSSTSLLIYEGSFDPNDTNANLVVDTEAYFLNLFSLQAGVDYVFVLVENDFGSQRLQYVLFPPGAFNFNPGLNGAWVAEGISKQGILMEVLPSAGILFFAQFTFPDDVATNAVRTSSLTARTMSDGSVASGGSAKVQAELGSADQRWLTAFGSIPANGNYMTINYENSTGGRFNSETPVATQDSNYGTGWIEGVTCDHLIFNWNLPGGITDTRDYFKATQDAVPYCQSLTKAGPPSAQW